MMTQLQQIETATDYYETLLILQYRGLPKASATIGLLTKQATADMLFGQFESAFDLDLAVGPQLDILGEYIGVSRYQQDILDIPYFGFKLYAGGGNPNGFTDYYAGVNLSGVFYRYQNFGVPNTALTDAAYQFLLKLKIILNHSDGTLSNIMTFLNMFLPGQVQLIDNQNMTLTYNVASTVPISAGILANFLPKPMGVSITVNILSFGTRITEDGHTRVTADGSTRVIITS
jgi:hypothetical protein